MDQAHFNINLYNQLVVDEEKADVVDKASEVKETIEKYHTYVSTLKLMHITSMKVKKSRDAADDQKNQLLKEALTLGDKCLHMANMADQNVLIA